MEQDQVCENKIERHIAKKVLKVVKLILDFHLSHSKIIKKTKSQLNQTRMKDEKNIGGHRYAE